MPGFRPGQIFVGAPRSLDVRPAGDFEGVVTFGLGLRERAGFRVFNLSNPTRIVVDVGHGPPAVQRAARPIR